MEWQKLIKRVSFKSGIRQRLLWIGLLFLSIALLTNTLAGFLYTRRLIHKEAAQLQEEVARFVARRIQGFINRKQERLQDASVSMSLHGLGSQEQRLLALVLLKNDVSFTEISVLDTTGMEVLKISERKVYLPVDLIDQSESEKFNKVVSGERYFGPVYSSDKAEPYITLAVPIKAAPTQVIGVVCAELNLKFLWEIVGDIEFGRAGYAYLGDGKGDLIAHKDPSLVLRKTNLSHVHKVQEFLRSPGGMDATPAEEGLGITGKAVLSTFAPVRELGWAVVLEEPVAVALGEVRRMEFYAFLLLGVGLLVGGVIIVGVSNRITEPIQKLHDGAATIARGNLRHRVEINTGDEIEELAGQFNKMAADLASSYATLEQKVERRTRELSALYDVTDTMNQSLDFEPVLQEVIKKITEIFCFDTTRIYLYDTQMDEVRLAVSFPPHREDLPQVMVFKRGQGNIGRMMETGEPVIFEDLETDPRYREWSHTKNTQKTGFRFFAAFPIKAKLKPIGAIVCNGKSPRRLVPEEVQLLSSMGEQIGIAAERATLFEETVKRAKELSALYDITATINQSLDLDVVLKEVMEKVLEIMRFDAARIYLVNSEGKELRLRAYHGLSPQFASKTATDLVGVGINGSVVATGKPAIFEDIQTEPLYGQLASGRLAQEEGFRSYASFPLKTKARTLGVINFLSYQVQRLSPKEVGLLVTMANESSIAIENARLFEDTARKARELSALYAVTTAVGHSLDIEEILYEAVSRVKDVTGASLALIFTVNWSTQELILRAERGLPESFISLLARTPLDATLSGRVVRSRKSIYIEDYWTDPRAGASTLKDVRREGSRSLAISPLKVRGKILGALGIGHKEPGKFASDDLDLLNSIAGEVAIALENAGLFEEVKNKTVELQRLNRDLEEASQAKSDFLASMSHELRSPLNVIIGNTDLIREGFFGAVRKEQSDVLGKILHYSQMLLKLITDLLTLSRIEARKVSLHISTLSVDEIVAHAKSYVEQINRNGRLAVLWEVQPDLQPLTTDDLKLEEILQNLIGNAFKFTPQGSIAIRVRDLPGKDRIEFSVSDTGIGIAKGDVERIFERFYQLNGAETGSHKGVGLGLSIVKNYLDMMRGDIRVESQPGKGTQFTVTLPYSV